MKILMVPGTDQNPYLDLIAESLGADHQVAGYTLRKPFQTADIVHVQWADHILYNPQKPKPFPALRFWNLKRSIDQVRKRGALVWTVHDLAPHQFDTSGGGAASAPDPLYLRQRSSLLSRVDLAITLSEAHLPVLYENFPEIPRDAWRLGPHPHYRTVYRDFAPRAEIRQRFAIPEDAPLVSVLGRIWAYKGAAQSIAAFRAAARPDEYLLVAGQCTSPELEAEVRAAAGDAPNIRLHLAPLSDFELVSFHRAADLGLFNHTRILNSGSVITALSLDLPVLVPREPAFEDLARQISDSRWITLFDRPLAVPQLRNRLDGLRQPRPPGQPNLDFMSLERVGAAHRAIYAEALQRRRAQLAAHRT